MEFLWIIVFSLLLNTFFAGTAVALATSNEFRLELSIKHGGLGAIILRFFLKHITLVNITLMIGYYLSLVFLAIGITKFILSFPGSLHIITLVINLLFALLLTGLVVTLIIELLSRTLIPFNPNSVLNACLVPLLIFFFLFLPISWFLANSGKLVQVLFWGEKKFSLSGVFSRIFVNQWVAQDNQQLERKIKDDQELKMFQKALDFSKVRVRDCMIPRTEIEAIDVNAGIEALKKKFISSGYSRIIVYRNSVDNIIGYINSKELFKHPDSIKEKLTNISFVPETMPASKMLHDFMQYHRSVAIVVDEYGGISGMVTLEDIIEEIFGEIEDEHDTDEWVEKQIKPNEFVFSGRLEIEYLNAEYRLNIPESEEYDTLAGFILFHYHTLPKINEMIRIDQYSFKILKVSQTRIELVYLVVLEE